MRTLEFAPNILHFQEQRVLAIEHRFGLTILFPHPLSRSSFLGYVLM